MRNSPPDIQRVLQPLLLAVSKALGYRNASQLLCVFLLTYHTGRFAARWFGDAKLGALAAWLCASSPLLLGLGSTVHTSILAATLSVLAARLLLWVYDRGGLARGMALGLLAGSIVLARPVEGTLVVAVCGVALVVRAWRGFRARVEGWWSLLRPLLGYAVGGIPALVVLLLVNHAVTGNPLQDAYAVFTREIGPLFGFGTRMQFGRTHTPEIALVQTAVAIVRVNAFLYGWPLSLAFVALAGWCRVVRSWRVMLLLAVAGLHLVPYFFLAFGSVHDFGHAYHVWHVPWLSAISAWVLVRLRAPVAGRLGLARVGAWAPRAAVGMTFTAAACFWPPQIIRWRDVSEVVQAPVRAAQKAAGERRAIVLWKTMQQPGTQRSWVFRPPAPIPDAQLLWAFDDPAQIRELRRRYRDRIFLRLVWQGPVPSVVRVPR